MKHKKRNTILALAVITGCWIAYKVIKQIIKETELDKAFDIDFS
jgi:hypothetical protein